MPREKLSRNMNIDHHPFSTLLPSFYTHNKNDDGISSRILLHSQSLSLPHFLTVHVYIKDDVNLNGCLNRQSAEDI